MVNPERAIAYRKQVSGLIEAVLADEISPRVALNCWPTFTNQDPSVQCVYTMLWYFEADEDRHHLELYYSDLQLKTLREANVYLKKGEPLPLEMLKEYQSVMAPPEYSGAWTWRAPLWWLQSQVKNVLIILETNPVLMKYMVRPKSKGPR
jgi:hypothetical protein